MCGVAHGQKDPVYTTKELQQKLETQKIELKQEALEDKVATQDKSIDEKIVAQDKRIGDANNHLSDSISLINIGAAFLVAATAFGGILINRSNKKATKEVKQEIEKLKTDTNEEVERIWDNADLVLKNARLEMDKKIGEIESLLEKAKGHVDNIETFESNAKNLVEKIQSNKEGEDNKEINEETERTVEEINEKLPVARYTFYDWFAKGYDAHEKELYEDAAFYYKKATESDMFEAESKRDKAAAYYNWGNALYELKKADRLEAAVEKYNKAIQIDENLSFAYNNLGRAMLELSKLKESMIKDQEEIKIHFMKAYELENETGLYNLACLYSLLDEKEEAFKWFEKTMQIPIYTRESIESDSDFDNLRQDPRFEALLNKYRPLKEEE